VFSVECDIAPKVKEIQQVVIKSSSKAPISGSFCLSFYGVSTSPIPFDASERRIESALESLGNIGNIDVTQSLDASGMSISWQITFTDNVGDLDPLMVSCNNLVGVSSIIVSTVMSGGSNLHGRLCRNLHQTP